jgi:hypothetical protein
MRVRFLAIGVVMFAALAIIFARIAVVGNPGVPWP